MLATLIAFASAVLGFAVAPAAAQRDLFDPVPLSQPAVKPLPITGTGTDTATDPQPPATQPTEKPAEPKPTTDTPPPDSTLPPTASLPTETPTTTGTVPTAESIAKLRERVTAAELSDADRARAVDHLDKAKEYLENAKTSTDEAKGYEEKRIAAPVRVDQLKTEKATYEKPFEPDPVPTTSVEITQKLGELGQQLKQAEEWQQKWKVEPEVRAKFKVDSEKTESDLKAELKKIEADLQATLNDPPDVVAAFKERRRARRPWVEAQLRAIDTRRAHYATSAELLSLENEVAPLRVARLKKRVAHLEEALKQKRTEEDEAARRAAEKARREALRLGHPELERIATENIEVAERLQEAGKELTPLIERTQDAVDSANAASEAVIEAREQLEEKLEIPDVETTLGQDLVRERLELPHVGDLRHAVRRRNAERARVRTDKDTVEKQLRPLRDVDAAVAAFMASIELVDRDEAKVAEIEDYVRERFQERKESLEKIVEYQRNYLEALKQLNIAELREVEKTEEYAAFLDEHSRWARSADRLSWGDIARTREGLVWLFDPAKWERGLLDLGEAMYERPVLSLTVLLLVVVLTILRERLRRRLNSVGEQAGRSYTAPYSLTLIALGCTIAVSLVFPLLVGFVGWTLWSSVESARFSRAVGVGLLTTTIVYATLEFVRQLYRSSGLANAHFHWRKERILRARHHLKWLTIVGLPSMFVLGLVHWDGNVERWSTLGRLALVGQLFLVAAFAHLVLRPIGRAENAAARNSWQSRMLHLSAAGIPIVLALLTITGYQYTTWRLCREVLYTIWLVLAVAVGQGMLIRWLYYSRARLALEQIRKRKEEQAQAQAETPATPEATQSLKSTLAVPKEPEIDLAMVNQHSRALVKTCVSLVILTGFWFIWYPEIPRFGLLDQALGTVSVETTQTVKTPDGDEIQETVTELRPITIADAVFAVIVLWVTVNLAKNVPGLLEVLVLQYLPMDAGGRYAASSLVRYVMTVVGIVIALGMVGIGWAKVQWLVAALSIGLGFGLQELFANFVCGLILLFERPIRVGDIVTVGDTTGIATKIQIRATTIRDWDRKEYIVPNKELITGRLLNWTLTDTVNRVVVNVGVAYGSDTDRARQLLFTILQEDADVLDDPIPLVTFEGFGDSTLNFVIRCYLPNLDNRLEVVHRLHTTIHRRFGAEGIEIAFPQRDIHVRTVSGVDAILGRDQPGRSDGTSSGSTNGNGNGNGSSHAKSAGVANRGGGVVHED